MHGAEDRFESPTEMLLRADPLTDLVELTLYGQPEVIDGMVQRPGDLVQRHPEITKREHLLQPSDILARTEPVSRCRMLGGAHQTDLVEVVQGAHGDGRRCRQFADLPPPIVHVITHDRR